ncbi:hypothetical protein GCM10009527_022500 [Actinomadura nitritigenes]
MTAAKISPRPNPSTTTIAKPRAPAPSAAGDGRHPAVTEAIITMITPGRKCTSETSVDAVGNSSRGRNTFRTSGAFPVTDRVVECSVSVNRLTRTMPENR